MTTHINQPPRAACVRCGAAFSCEPAGDCWCKHEAVRLPMPVADEGCLCAACLRTAAAALTRGAASAP